MPKKQGKNSLTDRVREIIKSAGPGGITKNEIAEKLDMVTRDDKAPLCSRLRDLMYKSREIEQKGIRPHFRYFWIGGKPGSPTIQEKMWRVLRARKAVTLADLMELAGASEVYAKEYMLVLIKNQIVKKDGYKWRMISDPVIMPDNTDKAEKLRKIRAAKKAAIAAMDEAFGAIARARMAMVEMEVEP